MFSAIRRPNSWIELASIRNIVLHKEICVGKLTGIHGTTNSSAANILACREFIPSSATGKRTLGEGVYFFDKSDNGVTNAHLWAIEKCSQKKFRSICVKPAMLSVQIAFEDARALDLDDSIIRELYEETEADLFARFPALKNNNKTKTQIFKHIFAIFQKNGRSFDIVLGTGEFYGDGTEGRVVPLSGRGCAVKNKQCIQMDTCSLVELV